MGEHTRIDDLNTIREMGVGLARIKDAFDGLDKLTGQYEDAFGEHHLSWRFGDFAQNWESRREELGDEIKRLAELAKATAKTYERADGELARALRESARVPRESARALRESARAPHESARAPHESGRPSRRAHP
ncbi:hypothetical protein ACFWZ2_23545 [Streptomyces sp. NPDC059002]|uniref:hypothetical protein n=1 Tax=Streptomyces sp. NPDC059002 TaxID=3346690 RepID=UPI0036A0412C